MVILDTHPGARIVGIGGRRLKVNQKTEAASNEGSIDLERKQLALAGAVDRKYM